MKRAQKKRRVIAAIVLLIIVAIAGLGIMASMASEQQANEARARAVVADAEQKVALGAIIEEVNATCQQLNDSEDNTCLIEEAAKIKDDVYAGHEELGTISDANRVYFVNELCGTYDDPDFCYYYVSVVTQSGTDFCVKVDDKTGCWMLSDFDFCTSIVDLNQRMCLNAAAYALSYIDKNMSDRYCSYIDATYHNLTSGDDFEGCDDIDYNDEEFYSYDFMERFQTMYYYMNLAKYTMTTKTSYR